MTAQRVVITGADGYLGTLIAARYLRDTDFEVVACVRARSFDDLTNKSAHLMSKLKRIDAATTGSATERLDVLPLDVRMPEQLEAIPRPTHLIHAAAITRFDVSRDDADATNVEGSRSLWRWAADSPDLQSSVHVSTVYATGLRTGETPEQPYDSSAGFANEYEWSKWTAEHVLNTELVGLPVAIARVATVMADDLSGAVTQHNAFHQTLKLLYYGLLSVVPGKPDTPLHFVTGDYASDAVFQLTQQCATGVFHVAHDVSCAPTLQELIDTAFEVFRHDEDFRLKKILPPLLADEETFELLRSGISDMNSGMVAQALDSMAPFAQQLFIHKDVRNQHMRSVLPGYTEPDLHLLTSRVCQNLAATRWGRRGLDNREQVQSK